MKEHDTLRIIFIRHAETDYADIGDRDPSDGELTENGRQQCLALGEKLKDWPIDAYITSSLLRSFRTAVGVCNAKSCKPVLEICPELVECGCTPGYYGCSEAYLSRYYENTKMCDSLFGTERYTFGCEAFEDTMISLFLGPRTLVKNTQKLISATPQNRGEGSCHRVTSSLQAQK